LYIYYFMNLLVLYLSLTVAILSPARLQRVMMKYILVTGGVISGIGKGIIASSVGTILKSCGLYVTAIKIDPYINIDAGTFSPYEHGEWRSNACNPVPACDPCCKRRRCLPGRSWSRR